ncbi:MAG: hypothetical protein ACK4MX_03470 [Thermaurantiacus sp.]
MTPQARLKRLERLLAMRQAVAESARRRFAQSVGTAADAAARVQRVGSLVASTQTGRTSASALCAAAQLRAMLREVEVIARQRLEVSVAERRAAERQLAIASARAERVAERTIAARMLAARSVEQRHEDAAPVTRRRNRG